MNGLERLPPERQAYYIRLDEALTVISFRAKKVMDTVTADIADTYRRRLHHLCECEGEPMPGRARWNCFDLSLDLIRDFCKHQGIWC